MAFITAVYSLTIFYDAYFQLIIIFICTIFNPNPVDKGRRKTSKHVRIYSAVVLINKFMKKICNLSVMCTDNFISFKVHKPSNRGLPDDTK
jgi:hypothetical protein